MDLAKKLKLLREINGLTQEELAAKLHISRFAITNYENGNRTPDINVLVDICDFYNISLDSLFKDEVVFKPRKKIYKEKEKLLLIVTAIISVLIVVLSSVITNTHNYDFDVTNDELKVVNSSEIAVVSFKEEIKKKNIYTLDYFKSLKGLDISYVEITNKNIEINFNAYYLIFGNRESTNKEFKNYISIDYMKIHSNVFIQELLDFNPSLPLDKQSGASKTVIDYYTYYVNKNSNKDIVYTNVINSKRGKMVINNKDVFVNNYDYFNLEDDFNVKFSNMEANHYKYIDLEITMKVDDINSITPIISLYSSIENDINYEIETIKMNGSFIRKKLNNKIVIHISNIPLEHIKLNNNKAELVIRYGYSNLIKNKWTNSNLSIRIGYKK